jgi:hypothetical protein
VLQRTSRHRIALYTLTSKRAAALPQIHPSRRKVLLQSIGEAAATAPGRSTRAPRFYLEWVEQEAA